MVDGRPFDEVLAAARQREPWALAMLFRAHHAPVLRYLRALERSAAEDLAADVWVAVTERLPTFVGDERAFRGWLFTIARNRMTDHRRRAARHPVVLVSPDALAERPDAHDTATLATDQLAAQEAVDRLIAALPADQAEIVMLRVVAGLTADEVASLTGRSPGAVRVIQHRALRHLAATFAPNVVTL